MRACRDGRLPGEEQNNHKEANSFGWNLLKSNFSRPEGVLGGEGGSPWWSSCWRGQRWSPHTSGIGASSCVFQLWPKILSLCFLYTKRETTRHHIHRSFHPLICSSTSLPSSLSLNLVDSHGLPLLVVTKQPKPRGLKVRKSYCLSLMFEREWE